MLRRSDAGGGRAGLRGEERRRKPGERPADATRSAPADADKAHSGCASEPLPRRWPPWLKSEPTEGEWMRLDEVPLFAALGDARRVLIAGAGGGFDVYSGVPLGLALQRRGVEVTWANLSFTYLPATTAEQVDDVTWRVTADLEALPGIYFPELVLAQWLADHDHLGEVFAFDKTGVRQLTAAYRRLAADRQFDAVVVVDGGSDSLLRGTETGLGTPAEDATTLLAADSLADVPVRLLVAAGFGVDAFHGVAHA